MRCLTVPYVRNTAIPVCDCLPAGAKGGVGVDRELGEAELVGSTLWEWIGKTQVFR